LSMRTQITARLGFVLTSALSLLAVSACQSDQPETPAPEASATAAPAIDSKRPEQPLNDEIPPAELAAVMTAHFKGLGHMERYDHRAAVAAFRDVHGRAPGWIPGAINLAIALLNDSGVQAEQAKKQGGQAAPNNFDEALDLLAGVLNRDPNNLHAH